MKIKISHDDNYIIYSFDIEKEEAMIIENNSNDFLDNIFSGRDYNGIKNWIIRRCGGKKTIEEAIKYAKEHLNEIPCGELEYISDSDELDEENCDFDD